MFLEKKEEDTHHSHAYKQQTWKVIKTERCVFCNSILLLFGINSPWHTVHFHASRAPVVAGESREGELVLLCTVCFKCAKRNTRTLSLTEPNNEANLRKAGFWLKTLHPLTDVMMQITNCLFYHLEMLWGFFSAYLYGAFGIDFHPESKISIN